MRASDDTPFISNQASMWLWIAGALQEGVAGRNRASLEGKARSEIDLIKYHTWVTHLSNTVWESNKNTIKHNTQESQEVRWLQGCNEQTGEHNKNMKHK